MQSFLTRYETLIKVTIFIFYIFIQVYTTLPAIYASRELADTEMYIGISERPIFSSEFLDLPRPFIFPLLLKITNQSFRITAIVQLGLTVFSWGALAQIISISLQPVYVRLFSFITLLALSLVRHLAGWDFVMMTESLSLSSFILFVACGIWVLREAKIYKIIILSIVAFIFAFTRDTNAYILVMISGMLLFAAFFRWVKPQALIVAVIFLSIFFVNNFSTDVSQRWRFPFTNVIGKRILPYAVTVQAFEKCGMPITPELLSLAGLFANANDLQFYNDPALDGFRKWVIEDGKPCYIKWLITNPVITTQQVLNEFDNLIYFQDVNTYFSRKYVDLLPSRIERILYPVYAVKWILAILTLAAFVAIYKKLWQASLLWSGFILLCLTIFPHLYITWHGDAMAVERHTLSVGLQLALTYWLFIFLVIELFLKKLPSLNFQYAVSGNDSIHKGDVL